MPLSPLEHLLTYVDSKYRLVIIAAKRTKQIMRGGEPLIAPKSFKPTYTALEEVGAGKLTYQAKAAVGALAQELVTPEAKPTWFRSLAAEETLAEGVMIEEEEEEVEETDLEEASQELLAESSEVVDEPEMTDLDALEAPDAAEDET
ncbi:MAG: DNA-directed RNA polymerase subunit omega [Candidatus Methylomirabilis oxyfera]|nr:DNA-directed RNA polymerase subunit omega [Candidatus Methylomirabilis oxyfera]